MKSLLSALLAFAKLSPAAEAYGDGLSAAKRYIQTKWSGHSI